ncbi:MAG TPA: hypothetical protein VMU36_10250 [Spirochaetia bacterium]|nr:hypothetical protein [Spirochaetia bacterium]
MSFRLKEAVYKVRCREPGCNFISEFVVKEAFMGVTEAEVDSEAIKIAKNMAYIKHDALHGRKHELANPEIFKISSSYDRIGGLTASSVFSPPAQPVPSQPAGRSFRRGERILARNEDSPLVCEIVRGSAHDAGHPEFRFRVGAIVGSAPVFHQKTRSADLVAAEDNTVVAFHDVKELTRSNPAKAREVYDRALDDVFRFVRHLEDLSLRRTTKPPARKRVAKPAAARKKSKPVAARARKTPRGGKSAKTRKK